MTILTRLGFILWISVLFGSAVLAKRELPWPLAFEGEQPDPRITWGELENGFRYAILPTDAHPGKVSVQLVVDVGSINEEEGERGFTNFTRRMAFEGGTHFDGESLLSAFDRLQVSRDWNVHSSNGLLQTSYYLHLDNAKSDEVRDALRFLSDVASRLLFDASAFEKQRLLLLDQLETEASIERRIKAGKNSFLMPIYPVDKAAYSELTSENVHESQLQDVKQYWEQWYRPDRMFLIVTGDIDSRQSNERVKDLFRSAVASEGPKPVEFEPLVVDWEAGERNRFSTFDQQTVNTALAGEMIRWDLTSKAGYRSSVVFDVAMRLMGARMKEAHQLDFEPYPAFWFGGYYQYRSDLRRTTTKWSGLLDTMYLSLCSLWEYGINEFEFGRALYRSRENAINADAARSFETPRALAARFSRAILRGKIYETGAYATDRLLETLDSITIDEVESLLREVIRPETLRTSLIGHPKQYTSPHEIAQHLETLFRESPRTDVERVAGGRFVYEMKKDFGEAGGLTKREEGESFGLATLSGVFENNVRINIIDTEREGEGASVSILYGDGLLSNLGGFPSTNKLVDETILRIRQKRFEGIDLADLIKANGVMSFKSGVSSDHWFWKGRFVRPEGLVHFLSFMTEWMEEADLTKRQFEEVIDKSKASLKWDTPKSRAFLSWFETLTGGDIRFRSASLREDFDNVAYDSFRDWFLSPMREGFLEVTILGDVDLEETLAIASKTVGTLKSRAPTPMATETVKAMARPRRETIQYPKSSGTEFTELHFFWPVNVDSSCMDRYAVSVLSPIINDKLKQWLRDHFSLSTTPAVTELYYSGIADSHSFRIGLACDSKDAGKLRNEVPRFVEAALKDLSDQEIREAVKKVTKGLKDRFGTPERLIVLFERKQRDAAYFDCLNEVEAFLESEAVVDRVRRIGQTITRKTVTRGVFTPLDPKKSQSKKKGSSRK